MTSACKYNDFSMGMCEWANCPDKSTLRTRSAYSSLNVLLAFVTVEITIALGNDRPGHASARSCRNADSG